MILFPGSTWSWTNQGFLGPIRDWLAPQLHTPYRKGNKSLDVPRLSTFHWTLAPLLTYFTLMSISFILVATSCLHAMIAWQMFREYSLMVTEVDHACVEVSCGSLCDKVISQLFGKVLWQLIMLHIYMQSHMLQSTLYTMYLYV